MGNRSYNYESIPQMKCFFLGGQPMNNEIYTVENNINLWFVFLVCYVYTLVNKKKIPVSSGYKM
jgi:hypothetical protein